MPAIVAGVITDVTWFIACDCAVDGVSLPGGLVHATAADGLSSAPVRRAPARGS
jgi:hypothetical protein